MASVESTTFQSKGDTGYTTAFAMLEALYEAGVKACFVNVGSDHPSIIEAIVKGKKERPASFLKFYTCPSEMTAISMADGYARVSGNPQAVIVHVDVGTQALAHGVHNASIGRAPVFIFAGLCPFTESGELTGSRTEYMHWLQEAPDQSTIVRQYCRFTGQIRTGLNVKQAVGRALQFAGSDPKGPVYLTSARETLAEEIKPYQLEQEQWVNIGPSALPSDAVSTITEALVQAERPLIITGYSGRNRKCPEKLTELANAIPGLRVLDTGGSDICFPMTHRGSTGFRLAFDDSIKDADTVFVLDCDVPWIPSRNPPQKNAKIYHVDIDPLNYMMTVSYFPAHGRWKADAYTALTQINTHINSNQLISQSLQAPIYKQRWERLGRDYYNRLTLVEKLVYSKPNDQLDEHNIGYLLKVNLPKDTVYIIEAVTCAQALSDQLRPESPGSWLNAGGTGIGWSNGAALGAKLALNESQNSDKFVCQVVGDGSYMCGSPASAAWVASKYKIPLLIIVLNNHGWNAPRNSTELVYPRGLAAEASNEDLNISFDPSPDYAGILTAASGGARAGQLSRQVNSVDEMQKGLTDAVNAVNDGRGAMLEVKIRHAKKSFVK